jgi:hypothetical protein
MPCVAHRRKTDVIRPWGMAELVSLGGVHSITHSRGSALLTPLAARRHTTIRTPGTSTTQRCQSRLGGTTPILVVTAIGRPQVRNKEGSCGNGQY